MKILGKQLNYCFCSLLLTAIFLPNFSFAKQIKTLSVFAEPSMAVVLTELSRIYSQKNGVIVSINFASASDLINDVESGEPADVFISANQDWITNLKQKGLIDIYNIAHIASDELVLVSSINNPNIPASLLAKDQNLVDALKILDQHRAIFLANDEGSSLGKYSDSLLTTNELKEIQVFRKLHEDKSSIINLVAKNSEGYSILFASQLRGRSDLRALSKADKTIFYQALVIAGYNMDTAREFLKFLTSPKAKIIFKKNGFAVE